MRRRSEKAKVLHSASGGILHTRKRALNLAAIGETAFGIHREKGHFGIIKCDTQI